MTWSVNIYDLDGSLRVEDLPWVDLSFTHVLGGPGGASITVMMPTVARADVEPGISDYRIFEDATLRAEGRILQMRVDAPYSSQRVTLNGKGIASILAHRLIDSEMRFEPVTETPPNLHTVYGADTYQEEILWAIVDASQGETGGDLGITQGTHVGGNHMRRRWYCREDGDYISNVFDDFAALHDGIDWALTPTLTDSSRRELRTWNPKRGSDLSGTIHLAGTTFLDVLSYDVDAEQIVTRGVAVGDGDCDPPLGDVSATDGSLDDFGLLEAFTQSPTDEPTDADEAAEAMLSPKALVGADVTYQLSEGPSIGSFDIGDLIRVSSARTGWDFDVTARVQEIEVTPQLPDDDEHTFVRVNWSEV